MWLFDVISELARTAKPYKTLTQEQKMLDKEIEDFMTFYMILVDKLKADKSPENMKKVDEEYMERVQKLSPKAYEEIKQSFSFSVENKE
jgi:gas vesicle protein